MLNRCIIVKNKETNQISCISADTYYDSIDSFIVIDECSDSSEAEKILALISENGLEEYIKKIIMTKDAKEIYERYSHLIYFFVDDKETAQKIIDKIKADFDIAEYGIKPTNRGNFKAKIAIHKEDVCHIACMLTTERKTIFVYDWNTLKTLSEESTECKNRYYRDFKYLCDKLINDEKVNVHKINEMIETGEIFLNDFIKETYDKIRAIIPEKDLKALSENILDKCANRENNYKYNRKK